MFNPATEAVESSTPERVSPIKHQLTLHDLQTVIEIFQGSYNFSATHPSIAHCYSHNMKSFTTNGENIGFFQDAETDIEIVFTIFRETQLQLQNDKKSDQIFVSEINTLKLEDLLSKYFKKRNSSQRCYHALVQLDGVLTNFANYHCDRDNTDIAKLCSLGLSNLLPLPAAEKYLTAHLAAINQSDILIKAVSNSCVESALIILKHISPNSIFNKDPQLGNNALELAIAKGRHHIDSDKTSSLPLGHVIDAIFAIVKKHNLNPELLHNVDKDNFPAIALALLHGDVASINQLLELGILKPTNDLEEPDDSALQRNRPMNKLQISCADTLFIWLEWIKH